MKEKIPKFVDKWGQTIVLAILVLLILSSMGNANTQANEKLAAAVLRQDENLQNLWSAIRQGSTGNLPPSPPAKLKE